MAHTEYTGIAQRGLRWARDPQGVMHAVRQSDGDCHSAMCCKFVRGPSEVIPPNRWEVTRCPECCDRLERPVVEGRCVSPPRAVAMGRGVQSLYTQRRGRVAERGRG